ncbi:hypothetical protein GTW37_36695 [Streptomyces sp. SID4931]|nr:hypothetical protein [Streptomyces sp. SID4931]SCG09217.1 hypothetical protein GA0115255_125112 [Streptomyces sp. Ncost-T6T-2b]
MKMPRIPAIFRVGNDQNRQRVNSEAQVVASLREAALRAIYLREKADQPGGARPDINPHTENITSYSLASMLTFDLTGDGAAESLGRVIHMIFAGQPERIESRRRWVVWELDRLGHTAAARRLSDMTRDESPRYMGVGMLPLGSDERKNH